jgi:hypothetical protein
VGMMMVMICIHTDKSLDVFLALGLSCLVLPSSCMITRIQGLVLFAEGHNDSIYLSGVLRKLLICVFLLFYLVIPCSSITSV